MISFDFKCVITSSTLFPTSLQLLNRWSTFPYADGYFFENPQALNLPEPNLFLPRSLSLCTLLVRKKSACAVVFVDLICFFHLNVGVHLYVYIRYQMPQSYQGHSQNTAHHSLLHDIHPAKALSNQRTCTCYGVVTFVCPARTLDRGKLHHVLEEITTSGLTLSGRYTR